MRRKPLREVLEAERLERERVRALIRDMDEASKLVSITEVHDGPHRRSTVTAPPSRTAVPIVAFKRLSQRGTTQTFGAVR